MSDFQDCMFQIINFSGMVFRYLYISFFPLVVSFMFVNAQRGYQAMAPFNKYNKKNEALSLTFGKGSLIITHVISRPSGRHWAWWIIICF